MTHSCFQKRLPFVVFFRDLRHLLRLPRGYSLTWTMLPLGMAFRSLCLIACVVDFTYLGK